MSDVAKYWRNGLVHIALYGLEKQGGIIGIVNKIRQGKYFEKEIEADL